MRRAVNVPDLVNIPPGGLLPIDAPVTDDYPTRMAGVSLPWFSICVRNPWVWGDGHWRRTAASGR
jgi:hypothetical protein